MYVCNLINKIFVFGSTPRSSKQWGKLVRSGGNTGGALENVLFGSSIKCGGGSASTRIAHARFDIDIIFIFIII